jgi:hypothetical protein
MMAEHGQSEVVAPRVVGELTTQRVLVMERFFGHPVDDVEELRASNVDGEAKLCAMALKGASPVRGGIHYETAKKCSQGKSGAEPAGCDGGLQISACLAGSPLQG